MSTKDTNSDKTAGFRDPTTALVELDGETITIDAAHHITNDRAQLLHLYVDERAGGIDVTIPLADSDAKAWARSDVGREALGLDTDDDEDDSDDGRLMTDGGLGRRQPGAREGRPVTPDNPVETVDIDTVERGDTVTHRSGAVAGHVINTWVHDLQAHGYRDVVEYVTADGGEVRSKAFGLITVCRQCGDIVLPDPDTGHVTSHGDADDCCNGGE